MDEVSAALDVALDLEVVPASRVLGDPDLVERGLLIKISEAQRGPSALTAFPQTNSR